jgi:hypothetical protein
MNSSIEELSPVRWKVWVMSIEVCIPLAIITNVL